MSRSYSSDSLETADRVRLPDEGRLDRPTMEFVEFNCEFILAQTGCDPNSPVPPNYCPRTAPVGSAIF